MKQKQCRRFSYRTADATGQPIPFLPLQGQFLKAFGFSVGTQVDVRYGSGFVHISKIIQERYGEPPEASACVPAQR